MMTMFRAAARRVLRPTPVVRRPLRTRPHLVSQICTEEQLSSPQFLDWLSAMKEPIRLHRKLWEWAYIAQALDERGLLRPGIRGLGFAVGTEPLASLFASRGCDILATDLDPRAADQEQSRWMATGQHATDFEHLNRRGLCFPDEFRQRVRLRHVDMNRIPDDLGLHDYIWSSCSFEHLGSIERGMLFVERSLRNLKPGGVAVHTTEFNIRSNHSTIHVGPDVLYRKRDIEEIARRVAQLGGRVLERDYNAGNTMLDWHVDTPPYYRAGAHLKLDYQGYTISSIGLIIEKL